MRCDAPKAIRDRAAEGGLISMREGPWGRHVGVLAQRIGQEHPKARNSLQSNQIKAMEKLTRTSRARFETPNLKIRAVYALGGEYSEDGLRRAAPTPLARGGSKKRGVSSRLKVPRGKGRPFVKQGNGLLSQSGLPKRHNTIHGRCLCPKTGLKEAPAALEEEMAELRLGVIG